MPSRRNISVRGRGQGRERCRGSTLLITVVFVLILAFVAGQVISNVSSRYGMAYRSSAWNEALAAAQAGIDTSVCELHQLLPEVRRDGSAGLGSGYTQAPLGLLGSLQISANGTLSSAGSTLVVTPPLLTHSGEGGTTLQSSVSLDAVALSSLTSAVGSGLSAGVLSQINTLRAGSDLPFVRLRSTGTAALSGGRRAGPSKIDNQLWRPTLVWDRTANLAATQPVISRRIEVLLRPVFAFEAAVSATGTFRSNKNASLFDSFNSTQSSASTSGEYDVSKRLQHGTVRTNSASLNIGGTIYGDAKTNGDNLVKDSHVTGTVDNASYTPLPQIQAPTWSGLPGPPAAITSPLSLGGGPVSSPARYKFTTITSSLHISADAMGINNYVEIYVTGNLLGGIDLSAGVRAKVYVGGDLLANASDLVNGSRRASYLQIYGVPPDSASNPQMRIDVDTDLFAAIYAPAHDLDLTNNNDFSGAIVARDVNIQNKARVHFDEALALGNGPLLRYMMASWKELTN